MRTYCMKFMVIALVAVLVANCQKLERDLWDDITGLDPSEWAPQDLQVEDVGITEKKLTWTYDDKNIEGFKLDRKKGDEPWQVSFQTFSKETRSWNETGIVPDPQLSYNYRIYAYAGKQTSAKTSVITSAAIPAPTSLTLARSTITSVTLNWQNNSTGEDGFRIERKQGTGDWEMLTTLTETNFTEESFSLDNYVSYRIAAYYEQYSSDFVKKSFNSYIPAPENLIIIANSATSVSLNWSYNLTGQEGFKIERKIDNEIWTLLVDNLNPNQNDFTDLEVDLLQHEYTYRVYTIFGSYISSASDVLIQKIEIGSIIFGGIVFYLDGNGGGLVCTESDLSTGTQWGCRHTTIGGTDTGIGTGASNTAAIVAGCSQEGIAAHICNDLFLNGYSDWFLPSKDELNLMYQNLKVNGLGGFNGGFYWSSSEYSSTSAWEQSFYDGNQNPFTKSTVYNHVRAVRVF